MSKVLNCESIFISINLILNYVIFVYRISAHALQLKNYFIDMKVQLRKYFRHLKKTAGHLKAQFFNY